MSPRLVQWQRRPHPQQFSIEVVFDAVRPYLTEHWDLELRTSSQRSTGVLPRLRAVLEARAHQGDVTHVLGDVNYLTLLLRRRSTVLTVHDTEFLLRHRGWAGAVYRLLWLGLPVRRCARVTVPSVAVRADVVRATGVAAERVVVVANPVRPGLAPSPLPPGRPVVLLVGALPNKNLDRSLAALQGLDVEVRLIGAPTAAAAAVLAARGAVVRRDLSAGEVAAEYAAATLLLFPSSAEGFGLPILEAQACGRPVVTSDREPMRSVAGGAAVLVDPDDVASIRAGLTRLLGDARLQQELVAAGLANIAAYHPSAIAAAYDEVYRSVLARPALAGGQASSARS